MNLLDILMHRFERWPYDELAYATQDSDGNIGFSEASPVTVDDGDGVYWTAPGVRVIFPRDYSHSSLKADDYFYAIITMGQWIEERQRRNVKLLTIISNSHKNSSHRSSPSALENSLRGLLAQLTARDYLSSVHQDWTNNYLTVETYAEHNEISFAEALTLIALASVVAKRELPEITE